MFLKSLWFNNYISDYLLEGNENNCPQKDFYKNSIILFTIAPNLQKSKCLSGDNWINRLQCTDKIEHYSATTKGMNFWYMQQCEWWSL